jgi:hypothetical protein
MKTKNKLVGNTKTATDAVKNKSLHAHCEIIST